MYMVTGLRLQGLCYVGDGGLMLGRWNEGGDMRVTRDRVVGC